MRSLFNWGEAYFTGGYKNKGIWDDDPVRPADKQVLNKTAGRSWVSAF